MKRGEILLFPSGEKVSFVVCVGQILSGLLTRGHSISCPGGDRGKASSWSGLPAALPSGSGSAELLFPGNSSVKAQLTSQQGAWKRGWPKIFLERTSLLQLRRVRLWLELTGRAGPELDSPAGCCPAPCLFVQRSASPLCGPFSPPGCTGAI